MRHPDLSLFTQAVLLSAIVSLTALMFFRAAVFFRNQYAGLTYRYPGSWTGEQITVFEWLRTAIGACLGFVWVTFFAALPYLPVSWPFGLEQALLTTGLLLLTNGWVAQLVSLDWDDSLLSKCRFRTGFVMLALWWIAGFAAILGTIGWATTPRIHLVLPHGTIA